MQEIHILSSEAGTRGSVGTLKVGQKARSRLGKPSRCKQMKQEVVPILELPVEARSFFQAFSHLRLQADTENISRENKEEEF